MFVQKETQSFKREGGITLIALIISIIILVILAAVSINAAYNSGIINYAVNGTENYIKAAEKEKSSIQNAQSVLENALLSANPYVSEKGVNTPKITEGMIPIKWNGTNWVVCARDDENWYNYTTTKMEWANMMLSDGTYKADTVQVGQVVQDADLGSMFVWIPRYAYSMTHYKQSFAGTADSNNGTTQNITSVVFLKGTTNEDAEGNRYARDYNADSQTPNAETEMIVHPAFNFGGKELTGIWVAKFEASNGGNSTVKVLPHVASWRNITIGNAFEACYNMRNKKVDNKNVYGITENTNTHLMKNSEWGAVAYLAASQYGKIPTLNSSSSYYTAGSNAQGGYVTNVSQSTTGTVHGVYDLNGGAWERVAAYYDNGADNLANGNGTGLTMFDSSNGYKLKSEWAAYWDKYEVEGDDGLAGYDSSTKDNDKIAKAAYGRVQLMKSHKGDAMYEVINNSEVSIYGWLKDNNGNYTSSNGWIRAAFATSGSTLTVTYPELEKSASYSTGLYGGDYTLIGTAVQPFVVRGGDFSSGSSAGVFSISVGYGITHSGSSFRPVVW